LSSAEHPNHFSPPPPREGGGLMLENIYPCFRSKM